jgi:ATP-dependent DNA ligase
VIILTTFDLDQYVYAALTAGACGFLLKDVTPDHLVNAVRLVRDGDALLAPAITRRLVERFASPDPAKLAAHRDLATLTPREQEVLTLLAGGLSLGSSCLAMTMRGMKLPVMPPVAPMLAKSVPTIPDSGSYEPKWDGFRSIVFRDGDEVEIGSRNERPMTRYFPELVGAFTAELPERCVVDGEIVLATDGGLDFEALQQRIHPAASRVALLAEQTPASFIAFDLLAVGDEDLTGQPFAVRRERLEQVLRDARPPVHVTPATTDRELALRWLEQFEGAGLDGVVAKPLDGTYQPDKRVMFKIKHERTVDCVVAGYRLHKSGPDVIGSLLLGLHTEDGSLASVGVIGAFPMSERRNLFIEMQPLVTTFDEHPWNWARQMEGVRNPRDREGSRWNAGKDLSFVPLRPERVVEVRYDHMEGVRFRHTAQFVRWRPDRTPQSCIFAQLDQPVSFDLNDIVPGLR